MITLKNITVSTIILASIIFCPTLLLAQTPCGGGDSNDPPGCPGGCENTPPTAPPITIPVVMPKDPNEIIGTNGYDSIGKWVSVKDNIPYKILFENDPEFATAPAQKVVIYMPIHAKLNPNSLRIGDFGFGSYTFTVPPNTAAYTQRLDVRDSLDVLVDVTAGLDMTNRRAFWIFQSIDPATGLPNTLPANAGFLPVNDSTKGNGEGYVTLTVQPVATAQTKDTASATADIIFDINEPLATNTWKNTIDAVAPTSHISKVDTAQNKITLHWSGQDDTNGSGVRNYELYVSDSGKVFTLYKSGIDSTALDYYGVPGNTYTFFTLATDNTGNKETMKKSGEVTVTIGGVILPVTWLYFTGRQQDDDALLRWATTAEINTKEFIIERSFDGRQFKDIGNVKANGNNLDVNNYQYTDKNAMLLKTNMLYYRLRQVDNDGKYIYSSVVSLPVHTNVEAPAITVYPNPFTQQIALKIMTVMPTDKTNWVRLTSINGKTVYSKKLDYRGNSTTLLNDLPQLANGIYVLNVSINGKLYKMQLVKQN